MNCHNHRLVQPLALWRRKQNQGSKETPRLPFPYWELYQFEALRKETYTNSGEELSFEPSLAAGLHQRIGTDTSEGQPSWFWGWGQNTTLGGCIGMPMCSKRNYLIISNIEAQFKYQFLFHKQSKTESIRPSQRVKWGIQGNHSEDWSQNPEGILSCQL